MDPSALRRLAKELAEVLNNPVLQENKDSRSFFIEQREALDRALDNSVTPDAYTVAVVGSFKVGKSSFVNALCNVKGLASVKSNPETAAITVFRYSERPFGQAHFIRREQWEDMKDIYKATPDDAQAARYRRLKELAAEDPKLRLDDLESDLISGNGVVQRIDCDDWEGKKGRKRFLDDIARYVSRSDPLHFFVDHLTIHVPVPFLRDGIELIDTPGLDDTDRYRVQLTEDYVKEVDAILFLTRSGNSYSQSDKEFILRQLRRKTLKHLRVVVTKCDETYLNACKDAEDRDEDCPSYEEHLALEQKRVTGELARTLDELLAATDIAEDSKHYFRKQLGDISLDFISSRFHTDADKKGMSGIDVLHRKLMVMLQRSERIAAARKVLTDAIRRTCERTRRFLDARLDTVSQDFSHDRVQQQLYSISDKVKAILGDFEKTIVQEVRYLKEQAERDKDLVDARIDGILSKCDGLLDGYAMQDLTKNWKRRRYGGWGSLVGVQGKVADTIFPHVELMLNRSVERFRESVERIKGHISAFQESFVALEREVRMEGDLRPIMLTDLFAKKGDALVNDMSSQIADRRNKIVRHLDAFVTNEVEGRIEVARERVTRIVGKGTTLYQNTEVHAFYKELKQVLRDSLNNYLHDECAAFGRLLWTRAESIYPDIRQELDVVIEDHINAIRSGLAELNEQQKEKIVTVINAVLIHCESALTRSEKDESESGLRSVNGDEPTVAALIARGETTRCEFKSTLRVNLHTGKNDKKIEQACLKTIAAFLNSNGGHLVIGVSDSSEVLGVEKDGFPNEDKMNLHLVNLLNDRLGPQHMLHIEPRFECFDDKRILVVRCNPSNEPVYVEDGTTERFYTRTGAATTELKPSEIQAFIRQRF